MRAITVEPGIAGSARLETWTDPSPQPDQMLVRTLALGVCGTDVEILSGSIGKPPPSRSRMVLGHESLGQVLEAPAGSGFAPGDWVVGIVRRPDPVPCPNCGVGEWDMCSNALYTERGIVALDGYASEAFTLEPAYAVPVDRRLGLCAVLTEPASVLAKAWDHIEKIASRSRWQARRVLVTGAGPIGLMAALLGVQRGLEVHVLDRVKTGMKPELVRALGATYHSEDLATASIPSPDVIIECTGVGTLVRGCLDLVAPDGIVCLTGLSGGGHADQVDLGALNRKLVLQNNVVFGSVNANRRHYQLGAEALAKADRRWLERLISREVPLDRWSEALVREPDDVKPIIVFG
jgi:threonine dehydrogenase-like Zn-dependent dehydrogenase